MSIATIQFRPNQSISLSTILIPNPEIVIEMPRDSIEGEEKEKQITQLALYHYFKEYALPELYKTIFIDNIKEFRESMIHEYVDNYTNPIRLGVPFVRISGKDPLLDILHFFYYGFASPDKCLVNRKDLWDIINSVRFYMYVEY